MTPDQALQILDEIAAKCKNPPLDREQQAAAVEAVRLLHELIHPKPKEKKIAKRKRTKR